MPGRLHREWSRFVKAPVGERFRMLHRDQGAGSVGGRLACWCGGVAAIAAGVVMIFTPGPGLLTIAFGAALLARESRAVAGGCDRIELRLRGAWRRLRRRGAPADRD